MRLQALLLSALLTVACAPRPTLVTHAAVTVSAQEVEQGENISLFGVFPQHRTATLVFRGTMHMPGQLPVKASASRAAEVRNGDRIDLPFDEDLTRRLLGPRANHGTFRGEIEVVFPPLEGTKIPYRALARSIVLDVRLPSRAPRRDADDEAEAQRFAEFVGVRQLSLLPSAGLQVAEVRPSSPAARLGLRGGDVVVSVDGVRIVDTSDFVPCARPAVDLEVRSGTETFVRTLTLDGWQRSTSASESWAFAIVAAAACATALLSWPLPWLAVRARNPSSTKGGLPGTLLTLVVWVLGLSLSVRLVEGGWDDVLGLLAIGSLGCALVTTAAVWLAIDSRKTPRHASPAGTLGRAAEPSISTFLHPDRWWKASRSGALVMAWFVCAAVPFLALALTTGGLRVEDFSRVAAGGPWDWAGAKQPWLLAAWIVVLLHSVSDTAEADLKTCSAAWLAVLGAVALLGGREALEGPASVFVVASKALLVLLLARWARQRLGLRPTWRATAGLLLVSCVLSLGWAIGIAGRSLERGLGWATFVVVTGVAVALTAQWWRFCTIEAGPLPVVSARRWWR